VNLPPWGKRIGWALVVAASCFLLGRSSVRVREVEKRILVTSEASQEARTMAYVGTSATKESTVTRWKIRTVVRVDGSTEREETGETGTKAETTAGEVVQVAEVKREEKQTREEVTKQGTRPDWLFSVWASVDRDLRREYEATASRRLLGPFFGGLRVAHGQGWMFGAGLTAEY